ncbi:MAG: class I SAM-dependent methyltransferase [Candidatus Omnitrophota bacterium]
MGLYAKSGNRGKDIKAGLRAAGSKVYNEDRIWSRYSNDKVDIGEELAGVIRTLIKAMPLKARMRALSVGSSSEPQFRVLETNFRGGLYLLDIEETPLCAVKERLRRQLTKNVQTICMDYNRALLERGAARLFRRTLLGNKKLNLVILHHSLYYSSELKWKMIFDNLYREVLAGKSAVHAVLMAAESGNTYSTTWLYNHFVGKFFGLQNTQSLKYLRQELAADRVFRGAQVYLKTDSVRFLPDTFTEFMTVVWMILLYPGVHKYSPAQRREVTEFVYDKFWKNKKPLVQEQDHLIVYKGIRKRGFV